MLDFQTWRFLCWILIELALFSFVIIHAAPIGLALITPFFNHTDPDPFFENSPQSDWLNRALFLLLILAGLALAFPFLFEMAWRGYYITLLILFALLGTPSIIRKISHTQQSHKKNIFLFLVGLILSFTLGTTIGIVLEGGIFHYENLVLFNNSLISTFIKPFPLFCGIFSVVIFAMHGACNLCLKNNSNKAVLIARLLTIMAILFYALGALFVMGIFANAFAPLDTKGYSIGLSLFKPFDMNAVSNPSNKEVLVLSGGWVGNYIEYKWMALAPLITFLSAMGILIMLFCKKWKSVFTLSYIMMGGIILTVIFSMYPFILPSASHPAHSLTLYDSSGSQNMVRFVTLFYSAALAAWIIGQIYKNMFISSRRTETDGLDKRQEF